MSGPRFLFVPGPTNIPDRVQRAMNIALEDHRAPDFPDLVLPLLDDLKRIFRTVSGTVFLFPSSGTGGWEAALSNMLSPGDKVLAVRCGHFSDRWINMCERFGLAVDVIDVEWGVGVPLDLVAERLAKDTAHAIKAVLICHNETTTGVTSDVRGVGKALKAAGHPALLLVDGVSSIASVDFRMDEWGVDLAVAGAQKGFMLPAGLAILCASPKALAARRNARLPRCFFDFEDMLRNNKDGYFPYTPAATLLRGLRESVNMLLEEGLENVFARHHRYAEAVRSAVKAWNLRLCAKDPAWYSDTVSAICVPSGFDSGDVVRLAYRRYQLSLGAGLSRVAGKVFRIGHLGQLTDLLVMGAVAGAEMTMRDLGLPVEAGSGSVAAQEYLRATAGPVQLSNSARA